MSHLQPGQHVFTVSAFYVTSDEPVPRVLLRRHPKLGRWIQPGGHIEPHQDPVTALIAEFLDEAGIDLTPYLLVNGDPERVLVLPSPAHVTRIRLPAGKPNPQDPEHFMVDLGYLIRAPHQPIRSGIPAQWVSASQLKHYAIPDDVRAFLAEVL